MFSNMMFVIFVTQKTAYDMRISDWSSDVGSSDLRRDQPGLEIMKNMMGRASASTLRISGASASSGRSSTAPETRSRTSFAAESTSRVGLNSMLMLDSPSSDSDVMV